MHNGQISNGTFPSQKANLCILAEGLNGQAHQALLLNFIDIDGIWDDFNVGTNDIVRLNNGIGDGS